MAWKETFSSSSISLKVSMALALLQALVYIIGYSTNCWVAAKAMSVNIGSLGDGGSGSGLFNQLGIKAYEGLWGVRTCLLDQCQTSEFSSIPGKRTPDTDMYMSLYGYIYIFQCLCSNTMNRFCKFMIQDFSSIAILILNGTIAENDININNEKSFFE